MGIGPGSICTTRMVAGVGVPQFSAIQAAAAAGVRAGVAVIADGGMRYSGDIAKAVAAGADAVMIGGMLAGAEESPGDIELYQGRAYKRYRGMGSLAAMRREAAAAASATASRGRSLPNWCPKAWKAACLTRGGEEILHQMVGGLRAAMGYVGAPDLAALKRAKYSRVSAASVRESHVHDVQITREAPNYQADNS